MTQGIALGFWDTIGLASAFVVLRWVGLPDVEAALVITLCFVLMLWNSAGWLLLGTTILRDTE